MAKKKMTLEEKLEEAIVKDTQYEVPDNWIKVKLGVVCTFSQGQQVPKDKQSENENGKIRFIRIVDYTQNTEERRYIDLSYNNSNSFVNRDDVVMVRYGATAGFVGRGIKGIIANNMFKITPIESELIDKNYLYTFLKSPMVYDKLNKSGGSSAMPAINFKLVSDIDIAIPPLKEQQRIVDKIESLFKKLDKAKELIEEARDDFKKRKSAILEKAFRGELTKEWRRENNTIRSEERSKLGDIVKINPKRDKLTDIDDNKECTFVPMPSVSEITGVVEKPLVEKYSKVKKGYTYFKENDVIFAKITPCMENGKSAIVTNLIDGFGFGSTEFHVIRCNENVLNRFVYHLVRSKFFRDSASQHMTGAVGQRRVPKNFLEEYEIILPILQEQKEIVRILDKLLEEESKIEELTKLQEQIELIKKSILAKAFRGQLGTNSEDDESAIELLKEILNK